MDPPGLVDVFDRSLFTGRRNRRSGPDSLTEAACPTIAVCSADAAVIDLVDVLRRLLTVGENPNPTLVRLTDRPSTGFLVAVLVSVVVVDYVSMR